MKHGFFTVAKLILLAWKVLRTQNGRMIAVIKIARLLRIKTLECLITYIKLSAIFSVFLKLWFVPGCSDHSLALKTGVPNMCSQVFFLYPCIIVECFHLEVIPGLASLDRFRTVEYQTNWQGWWWFSVVSCYKMKKDKENI